VHHELVPYEAQHNLVKPYRLISLTYPIHTYTLFTFLIHTYTQLTGRFYTFTQLNSPFYTYTQLSGPLYEYTYTQLMQYFNYPSLH